MMLSLARSAGLILNCSTKCGVSGSRSVSLRSIAGEANGIEPEDTTETMRGSYFSIARTANPPLDPPANTTWSNFFSSTVSAAVHARQFAFMMPAKETTFASPVLRNRSKVASCHSPSLLRPVRLVNSFCTGFGLNTSTGMPTRAAVCRP